MSPTPAVSRRRLIATAAAAGAILSLSAPPIVAAASIAHVTSGADSGAGSLRAALIAASADASIRTVEVASGVEVITISSPVVYGGAQALRLAGNGTTIDASGSAGDALLATGGADLTLTEVAIRDAGGSGLQVDLPAGAGGVLTVRLIDVAVNGSGEHGVWVFDQALDTSAGIALDIVDSEFVDNGFAGSDFDGVRADDGGAGDIALRIRGSDFLRNGADGLEMDEQQDGGVILDIADTHFDENGPFDPTDLDDGIDIDEADAGDITGRLANTTADRNFDQGIDLNENGPGTLDVELAGVGASGNGEHGIEYEEDDDVNGGGDLIALLKNVTAIGNGNDGIKLEEDGAGNLIGRIVDTESSANGDAGAALEQEAPGSGSVELIGFAADGNDNPVETDGAVTVSVKP